MTASRESDLDPSQVLELRQYTLRPGQRDALIDLFDRELLDPQEAEGMRVIGQFRDRDASDRFVWLRGFPDLASRAARLQAFYGGPVWQAHRDAANATMIDSDDVLLLRPVDPDAGFVLPRVRPATAAVDPAGALVRATIYLLREPVGDAFVRWFDAEVGPILAAAGAPPLARLRTEYGQNEFPRLPVREGVHAFVWFTSFAGGAELERHRTELARSAAWERTAAVLAARCASPPHDLQLAPTARSLLRHAEPVGYTPLRRGDVHDFDFLAGHWRVAGRRLVRRGEGCQDWHEFPAELRAALHLGGIANVDELALPTLGWSGLTVRHFRLADRQWTIRWISSRTGAMDPPVTGGFAGDRGEFYGEDDDDGRPVRVRFVWTRRSPDTARWEQAFSYDGGPWETNWVMEFTRVTPGPE
jgi:hypothetical protein